MVFGYHRKSKLPYAIKVVYRGDNSPDKTGSKGASNTVDMNLSDKTIPEVAISELVRDKASIVRQIDQFTVGKFLYMVSVRMSCGNLKSLFTTHKLMYLTEKELRVSARTLIESVGALHELGYIHNDI